MEGILTPETLEEGGGRGGLTGHKACYGVSTHNLVITHSR